MKILLLGIGYLGSHLLQKMSKSHEIIALDHGKYYSKLKKMPEINNDNIEYHIGDICDEKIITELTPEIDAIVNLVGGGGNTACLNNPLKYINSYVVGTQKVTQIAEKYDIENVILSSSIHIYPKNRQMLFEDTIPKPNNIYGFLKLASERILAESKLNYTILRFSNIYGYSSVNPIQEGGALGNFIKACYGGEDILIHGDGTQNIDYLHINDACDAILNVLDSDLNKKQIYNVGNGSHININNLADIVTNLSKKHFDVDCRKKHVASNSDVQNFGSMSMKKLKNELGWMPNIFINDGIEEMIKNYKTENR